ncbi:MAG: hypothetical protein KDC85_15795 [Saprospiraceae bacterium]|nr:hypothetical protein [Saprospiraceae bacterium]MCB9326784.1 hypothetical protein [Lewinellaceae bacterium]
MSKSKIKKQKGFSGNDKVFDINCGKCGHYVFTYLKLGKGGILRCYLSRILEPPKLEKLQYDESVKNATDLQNLQCPACEEVLGVPMKREDGRLAFRMRQGYFHRKMRK